MVRRWLTSVGLVAACVAAGVSDSTVTFASAGGSVFCVSEPLVDGSVFIENSVVAGDGSFFAVGTTSDANGSPATTAFVARFLANGSLDFSFGTRGFVRLHLAATAIAYGAAIDAEGRVVVSGTLFRTVPDGFVTRLLPDGTVDTSFGVSGVRTFVGSPATNVTIESGGRIVIAAGDVFAVDTHGAIDMAFGDGGRAGLSGVSRVVAQPSGRLVAVMGQASVHVVGLTADGKDDPTFGVGGANDRVLTKDHGITDVAVASDGTIVLVGQNRINDATLHPFLLRLLPSGLWDPAFTDVLADFSDSAAAVGVTISDDHAMAVALAGGSFALVAKFLPNGELDADFGDGGALAGDGLPWSLRSRSDGTLLLSVNDPSGFGAAVLGFDGTGGCHDPTDDIVDPISRFEPLSPARVLDTRSGIGRPGTSAVPAEGVVDLLVGGHGGVPSGDVAAVVLNVTVTDAQGPGYVTVWPTGSPRPVASSVNVEKPGQTIASLVTVPVDATGHVSFYMQTGGHLVADVMGYYSASGLTREGRLITAEPKRALDTRTGLGVDGHTTRPSSGQTVSVTVTGPGAPAPSTASAVVLNVTATDAAGPGFVTVWPGGARPTTSNINLNSAGQTIANQVVVPVGPAGTISLYAQNGAHLIADVVGWYTGLDDERSISGLFVPVAPTRHLDTRTTDKPRPNETVTVDAVNGITVPTTGISAVVGTLTVTATDAAGYFTAFPGPGPAPLASTINAEHPNQTIANHITTRLQNGKFEVFTQSGGDIIADITGWFTG